MPGHGASSFVGRAHGMLLAAEKRMTDAEKGEMDALKRLIHEVNRLRWRLVVLAAANRDDTDQK